MKYYILYETRLKTGGIRKKWVASAHYELSVEYLLKCIEGDPEKFDFLVVPFILTLGASLEANLNDWLVIDTFKKHGPDHYKALVDGYIAAPFARKLRLVVAVLTDNSFQLREDSSAVKRLDELIAVRNKVTHPEARFFEEQGQEKMLKHPLQTLTLEDCKKYCEAVVEFDRKFFGQYGEGYIVENDLIQELERIGGQVEVGAK